MLQGMVFLASPHINLENKQSWPSLIKLLRFTSGLPKVALSRAELDTGRVARLCMQWDELDLRMPIVSAYETSESSVRKSFGRVQKSLVSTILTLSHHAKSR